MANTKVIFSGSVVAAFILGLIIGAAGCHFYKESQKSGFVKGAERTQNIFTGK